MKRGITFVSLFLISILFISSCVQQSPATVDPSSCNGEEFTWSMSTSSIFYDSEGDSHVVTRVNVERDKAKFEIDGDSYGIGSYFGDPVYYDFNNNGADDAMLSALSYHPGRIWSRIGSVDVCLTFIEEDFGGCQGIEMIWPNDLSADREFVDVYGNTHVVGYLYIDLEQERILMNLDYHSWGIFGYEPNCIGPDYHPGYSEEHVLVLHLNYTQILEMDLSKQ